MEFPTPLIGWRSWRIIDDELVGSWRTAWKSSLLLGKCRFNHLPPKRICGCGIYAFLKPKSASQYSTSWHYMYFAEVAFMRLFVLSLIALSIAAFYFYMTKSAYLLGDLQWEMALVSFMLYRRVTTSPLPSQGALYGAVALTGKVLYYPSQGMRGQNARIICLVRPSHMSKDLAEKIALKYNVPLFDYSEKEKFLSYAREQGDLATEVVFPPLYTFSFWWKAYQQIRAKFK